MLIYLCQVQKIRITVKIMNITKTTVYLVRHGESVGNLNKICLGHTDLDLTPLGYLQAQKTAEKLKDIAFTAIYSSDLVRAMHTAEAHAVLRDVEVVGMSDFRELYFGDWENSAVSWLTENFYDMFMIGWRQNFGTFTAPSGESVTGMAKRMKEGILKIAREHAGGTLLVASHAAAIRALWGEISGINPIEWASAYPFPSNASYSILEVCGMEMTPIAYSIDDHLSGMTTNIVG